MSKKEKYLCPNCVTYLAGRIHSLKPNGFPDTPLCKSCGSECLGSENDDRYADLAELEAELDSARQAFEHAQYKYDTLKAELEEDWFRPNSFEDKPLFVVGRDAS